MDYVLNDYERFSTKEEALSVLIEVREDYANGRVEDSNKGKDYFDVVIKTVEDLILIIKEEAIFGEFYK